MVALESKVAYTGSTSFHFGGIELPLPEISLAPFHLDGKVRLHHARRVAVRNESRAFALEHGIAEVVVAVRVGVDDPLDGLVRNLADGREQFFGAPGVLARVDNQRAAFVRTRNALFDSWW